MADKKKQITFIEHKLQLLDNDLFKQVSKDLLQLGLDYNITQPISNLYTEALRKDYKNRLHILKMEQKQLNKLNIL